MSKEEKKTEDEVLWKSICMISREINIESRKQKLGKWRKKVLEKQPTLDYVKEMALLNWDCHQVAIDEPWVYVYGYYFGKRLIKLKINVDGNVFPRDQDTLLFNIYDIPYYDWNEKIPKESIGISSASFENVNQFYRELELLKLEFMDLRWKELVKKFKSQPPSLHNVKEIANFRFKNQMVIEDSWVKIKNIFDRNSIAWKIDANGNLFNYTRGILKFNVYETPPSEWFKNAIPNSKRKRK